MADDKALVISVLCQNANN